MGTKRRPPRPRSRAVPRSVTVANPPDDNTGAAAFIPGPPATYNAVGTVQPMPTSMTYQVIENDVAAGAINPIALNTLVPVPGNPNRYVWGATLTDTDCPDVGDGTDTSQYTIYVTAVYAGPPGKATGTSDFYRSV